MSKKPVEPTDENICPKCGSELTEVVTTASGKQLRRCTKGVWNPQTRKTDGCDYVKWLPFIPQELDEKCPKCGSPLVMAITRFGKKMKKCSTGGWDSQAKKPTGCTYVQWLKAGEDTGVVMDTGEEFLPPEPEEAK